MIPLSPALLVAAAGALCRLRDHGSGALVEQLVRGTGDIGSPRWDAAFVHYAGFWSHFDHRTGTSSWPLPATACCNTLAEFARTAGALCEDPPQPGELFLLWSPARKLYVRTGIILGVEPANERWDGSLEYDCHTIEGNLAEGARLDGSGMGRVARRLSPALGDRTIRWTALEPYEVSTRTNVTERMELERDRQLRRAA